MKVAQNYYCNECQARVGLEPRYIKLREVEGHEGIQEMGVVCLRCDHWHHAWFDGPELAEPRARYRRAHKRMAIRGNKRDAEVFLKAKDEWLAAYRAFQEKMREATGVTPAIVVGEVQDGG